MAVIAASPTTQAYVHAVAVYDGEQMMLYIDGTLAGTTDDTRPLAPKAGRWTVGMSYADHGIFDGSIDELAYYPSALTADRVKLHHDVGVGR
jgi:hypothetical protein